VSGSNSSVNLFCFRSCEKKCQKRLRFSPVDAVGSAYSERDLHRHFGYLVSVGQICDAVVGLSLDGGGEGLVRKLMDKSDGGGRVDGEWSCDGF
jgi:hypothetical protein